MSWPVYAGRYVDLWAGVRVRAGRVPQAPNTDGKIASLFVLAISIYIVACALPRCALSSANLDSAAPRGLGLDLHGSTFARGSLNAGRCFGPGVAECSSGSELTDAPESMQLLQRLRPSVMHHGAMYALPAVSILEVPHCRSRSLIAGNGRPNLPL